MALSKHRSECGFDFYGKFSSLEDFEAAPVGSFAHVPLSLDYDENVVENLLVEVAHSMNDSTGQAEFWVASVVKKKGFLVYLRWLGAPDSSMDFWRNFASYKKPERGRLDERIHPVGWARKKKNKFQLMPPHGIRRSRENWEEFLAEQLKTADHILTKSIHDIVRAEIESVFRPGMVLEITDVAEMEALQRGVIRSVIGRRIEFSTFDGRGNEQRSWFHEFSDDIRPSGWWSVIGQNINESDEYKESSKRSLTMFYGPEDDDNRASIHDFKPRLVSRSLAERLLAYNFKRGSQVEVIDPLRPGISVATIVDVLQNSYLIIEIDHAIDLSPKYPRTYRMCVHVASESLLPRGFAELHNLRSYFNPPRANSRYGRGSKVPWELFQRVIPPHDFRVKQVLEVLGIHGSDQIYVGSIMRIVGHLLLIRFEGWQTKYTHFFPITSPDIYPVGYCDLVGHRLLSPTFKGNKTPGSNRRDLFVVRKY